MDRAYARWQLHFCTSFSWRPSAGSWQKLGSPIWPWRGTFGPGSSGNASSVWDGVSACHNNLYISPSFFLPVSVSFNPSSSCSWYLLLKCGQCEWVIFEYRLVCSIPPRGFLYRTTLRTHQIDYRRANTHPSSYLATNKAFSFHHCSVLLCAEEKDKTEEDRQRQICEPFISLAILIHTDGGLIQLLVSMKCFLWASVHAGCFKQDSHFRFIWLYDDHKWFVFSISELNGSGIHKWCLLSNWLVAPAFVSVPLP